MTVYADKDFVFEYVNMKSKEDENTQKSIISCPACGNQAIEIVSRCATCKICGWSICSA